MVVFCCVGTVSMFADEEEEREERREWDRVVRASDMTNEGQVTGEPGR